METLADLLKSLAKIPGAEDLAKKAAAAAKAEQDEADGGKGELATVRKALAKAEKERDAYKRDLDSGATGKDEAVKAAQAERETYKTKAEAAEAARDNALRRAALGDALGIADPVRRRHATNVLLTQLPPEVVLDDAGNLVGAAKAVSAFRAGEGAFYWQEGDAAPDAGATDKGNGGKPAGSGRAPLKSAGPGASDQTSRSEKIKKWDALMGRGDKTAQH